MIVHVCSPSHLERAYKSAAISAERGHIVMVQCTPEEGFSYARAVNRGLEFARRSAVDYAIVANADFGVLSLPSTRPREDTITFGCLDGKQTSVQIHPRRLMHVKYCPAFEGTYWEDIDFYHVVLPSYKLTPCCDPEFRVNNQPHRHYFEVNPEGPAIYERNRQLFRARYKDLTGQEWAGQPQ